MNRALVYLQVFFGQVSSVLSEHKQLLKSGKLEKGEMASTKNPKKANLLDHNSIKHILDESVNEIVTSKGYPEDVRISNIRLLIGMIVIAVALFAQFYHKKFPENRNFLIGCVVFIQWDITVDNICEGKDRNPIHLSSNWIIQHYRIGCRVKTAKILRYVYLVIGSADPQSISAKPPVEFTKTVTQWFTKDGVLVEGLFWKDVEGLIKEYAKEAKKSK